MRSIIIIPPSSFLDDDWVFPQLGPYYIKRYVEARSYHKVDVFHALHNLLPSGLVDDYDLVAFSVTTPQYPGAVNMAKQLYRSNTVIGGPHCMFYGDEVPRDLFRHVVAGDGCHAFLNVLSGGLPVVQEDPIDLMPYRDATHLQYRYMIDDEPATVIMTSRGCPHHCRFCEHAKTKLRLVPPHRVGTQISESMKLGFKSIMFFDDLFCLNQKRVEELCKVIKPFDIAFRCFAHAKNFDDRMASVLASAGCVEVGYGAEHADQDILDAVGKGTTAKDNYNLVKVCHDHGIRAKAFLMIGLPGESPDSILKLEAFLATSGVDDFDLCVYHPYKGTYIHDHIEDFDIQIEKAGVGYYKGKGGESETLIRTSRLSAAEIALEQARLVEAYKR